MINPYIQVECNHCGKDLGISLAPTTKGSWSWDDYYVKYNVESRGWIWIDKNIHFCSGHCKISNRWQGVTVSAEVK